MKTARESHDTTKLDDINSVIPENNFVLCLRLHDNINDTTESGINKASEYYNRDQYLSQNVERIFQVVAIPGKIKEERGFWMTDLDVKVGDKVVVSYFDSLNSKVAKVGKKEYRFIKYFGIVAIIKDDEIIPVNGNILFSPVYIEPKKSNIIEVIQTKKIIDYRFGIVEKTGKPNKYYTKGYNINYDKDIDIKVGDKVVFTDAWSKFAPVLEHELHRKLDKEYYYCQRYQVGGKII
ncbi:hypothetical protein JW865_09470 [Candidatus Bathyarchaeota archaeon]|nr:hypothetical protein [Candidatus Bathyarchaeota archaeon]